MISATQASQAALIAGIRVSDSTLANEITEFIRDTKIRPLLFNSLQPHQRTLVRSLVSVPGLKFIPSSLLRFLIALGLLFAALLLPGFLQAQNAVTGALTGVVTDSTGAIVPGATVKIVDTATNATTQCLQPIICGTLQRSPAQALQVSGQCYGKWLIRFADDHHRPGWPGAKPGPHYSELTTGSNTTIEVSSQAAQLTDTQSPASITTLTEAQIQNLPAPGGDITTIAFTAPGVVLNSGGAYGNFSSDGLPGVSNLFVLNGYDDEDPFLNLNNSGSSNLTLGQGEVSRSRGGAERLQCEVWSRSLLHH